MTDESSPFDPARAQARSTLRLNLDESLASLGGGGDFEPSIEDRIAALGFSGRAARAFDLLPLVLVAWADGSIQAQERITILDVLKLRGLVEGDAYTMMETLLEEKPADVYLDTALSVLRDLLEERDVDASSIVDLCVDVAAAAAAYVGADPISDEERLAIARVADALGQAPSDDVLELLR